MRTKLFATGALVSWCSACGHAYAARPAHEVFSLLFLGLVLFGAAGLSELSK